MTRELKEQTNDLVSYIREDTQRSHFIPFVRDLCVLGGKLFFVECFFKKTLVTELLPVVISDRATHRYALRRQRNNPIIKMNVRDDQNRFVIVSFPRRASGNVGRHAKSPISGRALEATV